MTRWFVTGKLILVTLLLLLAACTGRLGNISGTVFDEEGEPVAGAMLQVAGHSVVTDGDGEFLVAKVPPGEHRVTVNKAGVGALTTECTVRGRTTTTCDLVLIAEDGQ